MRICFIAPKAYELFNETVKTEFGGAEVQMYLISNSFAENTSHNICFIVADYGQEKVHVINKVQLWKSFKWSDFLLIKMLKFFFVFIKTKSDVYFQMAITPFSLFLALACKILRRKFIYLLAHDTEVEIIGKNYFQQLIFRFSKLVFRFSYINISQNQYQHNQLILKGLKSIIIRSSFHIDKNATNTPKYHLWIARAEKWKRPEIFINIAKLFPNEEFFMICPKFREVDLDYFKNIVKEANQINNLKFSDQYIPFSDLDKLFANAKTFVMTSTQEGFATTLIHACKFGVPILSLNVNPDNFITNYGCGLFCNDDIKLFIENFKLMMTDQRFYEEMSKNAKNYISENHDIIKNVVKINELIG